MSNFLAMGSASLRISRGLTFLSIATIISAKNKLITMLVTLFLIACNDFVELILNTLKSIRRKHRIFEILSRSKLNSIESIILKPIQKSNVDKKGYAYIHNSVKGYWRY